MHKAVITYVIAGTLLGLSAPRAAAAADEDRLIIKDLRVLVVVYRGDPDAADKDRVDDAEMRSLRNAMEVSRDFYFRNTDARLNLTLSWEIFDKPAPDNAGPTYDNFVKDLRARGYIDNQFDGIFTTGIGMTGNWGGFRVFDKTGACFGGSGPGGQLVWYPSADKDTNFHWAWTFVHEFQHALDLAIAAGSGFDEFVHGHPFADQAAHPDRFIENAGGQHWDWEACTLRNFKDYPAILGATSSYIYAVDSDGDGLADYHPHLPMDEQRFGSDPHNPDTDGDGLSDLAEYTADIYRSSDPLHPDTDRDGMRDGVDEWPTVPISPFVDYAHPEPAIDGVMDGVYTPLICHWYATDAEALPSDAVQTYATWDEDNLYIVARAPEAFSLREVQLDTSADNTFWRGGDTYVWRCQHEQQPEQTVPQRRPWPDAEAVWTVDDAGYHVVELKLPAEVGQGWSREVNFGGQRAPEDVADGLVLIDNRKVSFNIIVDLVESEKKVLLTPNWTMFSTTLRKSPAAPDRPSLRFTPSVQATDAPTVVVTGVRTGVPVTVTNADGEVLGEGRGSGPLTLQGVEGGNTPAEGMNVITVTTAGGAESAPFELSVDSGAAAPQLNVSASDEEAVTLDVSGEAGARVTLEVETGDGWLPVGLCQLDEQGTGQVTLDPQMRGFHATYFATYEFSDPVAYRIDPQIKFDYQAGTPIKGVVPQEGFSVRWRGFLTLEHPTAATFMLTTDDGSRLYIDGKRVIDHWGHHEKSEARGEVELTAGTHELRVDYYEQIGWAAAHLECRPAGGERTYTLPVTAVQEVPEVLRVRAYQVDPRGHRSEAGPPVTVN